MERQHVMAASRMGQPSDLIIFDTTLRDGAQAAKMNLDWKQKLTIAEQLKNLGVHVIEAGFPISGPPDFKAVSMIAEQVRGPIIAALARTGKADIDRAAQAIKKAERGRIHVFVGSSDIHIQNKLRRDRSAVLEMTTAMVKHAKSYCEDVEFSTEDGSRTDFNFLCRIIEAAILAGATTINVPDTVGYGIPEEYGDLFLRLKEAVPALAKTILSTHCHNDLGLAVANSLAAIRNGAGQVECTMLGVGERAGNASLEQIVMALDTRYGIDAGINKAEIYPTCQLVSRVMSVPIPANLPIVGDNAFSHSSGIHQDGVLKDPNTYQILDPAAVGIKEVKSIVITTQSGHAAVRHKLSMLGIKLETGVFERVFRRTMDLAAKKKEIRSKDLLAIVEIETNKIPEIFSLAYFFASTGNTIEPSAHVELIRGKERMSAICLGNGPVDAAFNAIRQITGFKGRLVDYYVKMVSEGASDALGEATLILEASEEESAPGIGLHPDVVEASARAFLDAINRLEYRRLTQNGNGDQEEKPGSATATKAFVASELALAASMV